MTMSKEYTALLQWLSKIDLVRTALLVVCAIIVLFMLIWVVRRLRKPKIVRGDLDGDGCALCARIWTRIGRLLDAIDYLATRREWRYGQPWVLLLGEHGAGKSSLVASVSANWRQPAPKRASELKATGMRWSYFRHGALIDADGALSSATPKSDGATEWQKGLEALDALRPERPLDGVVLCVSARTLCNGSRAVRAAAAAEVNRQLNQLQESVEFMLPAYVVVTQCDAIPGFSAFWHALGKKRQSEMFGYSATPGDQEDTPEQWADTAIDQLGIRLRELQVDVAALSERIEDVDGFFLFPGHFRAIREPLGQWLDTVFRTNAWQSGYLFRGVYFTGSVEGAGIVRETARDDVAFVDALISDKALREPALAKPTRKGYWSRNDVIRRVQYGVVVAGCCLFVALGFAAQRLSRQVDALVTGIHKLDEIAPRVPPADSGECLARDDIYPLLAQISRVDTRSKYLAIPMSWVDGRITDRSAMVVGNKTVRKVLMPTLACQLERRSRALLASSRIDTNATRVDLASQRAGFHQLIVDARALEDNIVRYKALSDRSESMSETQLLSVFGALSNYAFGEPLPKIVLRKGGVLDDAFRDVSESPEPVLPLGLRKRLATAIEARSATLRSAMTREVATGNDLLGALDRGEPPILENTRRMGLWLQWVQGHWLGSTAARNPCQDIVAANKDDLDALIRHYGDPYGLDRTLWKFGEQPCYRPELQSLAGMKLSPYGPLFLPSQAGMVLSPALQGELGGMPALVVLPFMQLPSTAEFSCAGGAASWRANEIAEAAGYLDQYEAFAKSRKLTRLPEGGRPLYDRLARASLLHAMDDALRRAQRTDTDDGDAATARSDASVSATGDELARGQASLERVLDAYASLGNADGGAIVRQCARSFASDNLGAVDALADGSRLYAPPVSNGTDALFALDNVPVVRDFLARQVDRAQVLASYSTPFLTLLDHSAGVDDAWRDTPQTPDFWHNTRKELDLYTKGKEPSGQVANLDAFFLNTLSGMTYANCSQRLAAYASPEFGNDLFSDRRHRLERQVQLRCTDKTQAQAEEVYGALATRFNRDLAGRYPFADTSARDASPAVVREFFIDYAGNRQAIGDALRRMSGNRWREATRFVAELDSAAEFFASNVAAPDRMAVIGVDAQFPDNAAQAAGNGELLWWRLRVDQAVSQFPNAIKSLTWLPDDGVALDLRWADRSTWRPVVDPDQPALHARELVATFTYGGPWALLRAIDAQRVAGTWSGANPAKLAFHVPMQGVAPAADGKMPRSDATVFMSIQLTGTDPTSKTPKTLALPAAFPRSAPTEH